MEKYPLILTRSCFERQNHRVAALQVRDASGKSVLFTRVDVTRLSSPIVYRRSVQREELYQLLPKPNAKRRAYDVLQADGTPLGSVELKQNGRLRVRYYDLEGQKIGRIKVAKGDYAFPCPEPETPSYILLWRHEPVLQICHQVRQERLTLAAVGELPPVDEGLALVGLCLGAAYQLPRL